MLGLSIRSGAEGREWGRYTVGKRLAGRAALAQKRCACETNSGPVNKAAAMVRLLKGWSRRGPFDEEIVKA